MPRFLIRIVLITLVIPAACSDEETFISKPEPIPEPFKEYFISFLHEAEIRGVTFDTTGFTISFVDSFPFTKACGIGISASGQNPAYVQISKKNRICWDSRDQYWRKEIMFHEFGHALLHRGHDYRTMPNGEKRSIMYPWANGESTTNSLKTKYYIDELFNKDTPIPDWAN